VNGVVAEVHPTGAGIILQRLLKYPVFGGDGMTVYQCIQLIHP